MSESRPEFEGFRKLPRLNRECVITEKIDGTNAQIVITESGEVFAGSRTRWITPEDDNFGFAKWVKQNEKCLAMLLGVGRHFGEWWGPGIQRGYGIREKQFSLFNADRWHETAQKSDGLLSVVPVLARGLFTTEMANGALQSLRESGSIASPGFMRPEGIVVYHKAADAYFKATLDKDDEWKGKSGS
jgi:hypothetical protein